MAYQQNNMSEKAKKELLWNELETNLANIDEDVIIENATCQTVGVNKKILKY